ncbi:hypothetical protein H310_14181 [Aphanomyces invadans]|uniref:Uncharacterized protein n=1 Tax=Aphanomyces invadans TaxID=157072 RepID=A0A024TAZ1_9STRA|nr:hypothetical protein H310_14181 [Aphanomyces invadans]ETV91179.1 hypothetical protein H310_14181 [Aphanomyces invadans]|eukprot:XP_008880210.1 hypothetical protein H310_14181 [Aphanomyces invadans]
MGRHRALYCSLPTMGCCTSHRVEMPLRPERAELRDGTTTVDNNSQPTVLDSENTLFQYSSQSSDALHQGPNPVWHHRPAPPTMRTTEFIANELQQYPATSMDNIWSDSGGGGRALPPSTASTNIWSIQSRQVSGVEGTSNIWGVPSHDLGDDSLGDQQPPLWRYAVEDFTTTSSISSDVTTRNVWSGHLTDSGATSDCPPPSSTLLALPRPNGLIAIDEHGRTP